MADKEKSKGGGGGFSPGVETAIMAAIALASFFFVLWPVFGEGLINAILNVQGGTLREGAVQGVSFVHAVLNFFGFLALIGIAYVSFRFSKLNKTYLKDMLDIIPEDSAPPVAQTRWKIIKEKALSHNPSDRKIAIIEADAMLDEMVKKMGYSGETLAERLKNIETSDFLTINLAWEAHKFRNKIAHEAHEVNIRDARRVIDLYEQVFQEFTYL